MNTFGRLLLQVTQEDCDDLNLLSTHCYHCVSEVVLEYEIKECLSKEICNFRSVSGNPTGNSDA